MPETPTLMPNAFRTIALVPLFVFASIARAQPGPNWKLTPDPLPKPAKIAPTFNFVVPTRFGFGDVVVSPEEPAPRVSGTAWAMDYRSNEVVVRGERTAVDVGEVRLAVSPSRRGQGLGRELFTSFLLLAATGLPLLFNDAVWARPLATIFGGFGVTGVVHRVFAEQVFSVSGFRYGLLGAALAYAPRERRSAVQFTAFAVTWLAIVVAVIVENTPEGGVTAALRSREPTSRRGSSRSCAQAIESRTCRVSGARSAGFSV